MKVLKNKNKLLENNNEYPIKISCSISRKKREWI